MGCNLPILLDSNRSVASSGWAVTYRHNDVGCLDVDNSVMRVSAWTDGPDGFPATTQRVLDNTTS